MTTLVEIPESVADALAKARAARDEGMAQSEDADTTGWDRALIDQAISAFASLRVPFSSNTIRPLLPDVRPSLIGARFMAASVRGEIRRVGLTPSTKKNTHSKDVALWIGARQ